MSRNTFILLGLLTGSVAMIGCSKNITAPSVESDRQAQALTSQAVPEPRVDDQVESEFEEVTPKAGDGWKGNKLRFNDVDMEVGDEGEVQEVTPIQPKPKNGSRNAGKLRHNLIDSEVGEGDGITLYDPIRNKMRQVEAER